MKKALLILLAALGSLNHIGAQNILNPSFDSVYFGGIDRLFDWITSDGILFSTGTQGDTALPLQPLTAYTATGFQFHEVIWVGNRIVPSPLSSAAIELQSQPHWKKIDGSFYESFISNGNYFYTDSLGYPDLSRCGIPFTARPLALNGFYRYTDSSASANTRGKCIVLLKRWNATTHRADTIAYAENSTALQPTSSIQPFTIALNYRSAATPDTLMVAFLATSNPAVPATLWLDALFLSYTSVSIATDAIIGISIWPNPVATQLRFAGSIPQTATITLCDAQGKTVLRAHFQKALDVRLLPAGMYLVRLENNGKLLYCGSFTKTPL